MFFKIYVPNLKIPHDVRDFDLWVEPPTYRTAFHQKLTANHFYALMPFRQRGKILRPAPIIFKSGTIPINQPGIIQFKFFSQYDGLPIFRSFKNSTHTEENLFESIQQPFDIELKERGADSRFYIYGLWNPRVEWIQALIA